MTENVELLLILDLEGIEHKWVVGPSRGEMDIVAYSQLLYRGLDQCHRLTCIS